MTARLLLVAIVSLIAAGAAAAATAIAVATIPTIVAQNQNMLSPGIVSLMGAGLALAYALTRPRKVKVADALPAGEAV